MALLAHYKLDDDAEDCSGNGYHGTPYNMSWADGKIGKCGSFNGVNSRISFGNGNTFFPLPEFSVSIWFKSNGTTPTTGTTPSLFGFTYGIRAQIRSSYVYIGVDNGTAITYFSSPSTYDFYNDNLWHHLVLTVNPTQRRVYIDGIHVATKNDTWIGQTRWGTNAWNIGRDNNNSMYFFTGDMDDFCLYSHVLTQKEVTELSRAKILHYTFDPDMSDESGFQTDPNSINCNFSTDSKIKTQSASFDGSTTNAVIPNTNKYLSPHLGDFSVIFWMKSSSTANERIFSRGSYLNDFEIWKTSGIRATIANGSTRIYSTGSINIADNNWHHIAVVYNRTGDSVVYVDTVIDPTGTNNISSMADIDLDPPTMYLGSYGTSGSYRYTGLLDDLRFFNTALSETDIKELFQTRASLDINGDFHVVGLNETWHKPLMLDYTTWQNGQTGSVTGFSQNGSTSENYRILGVDPWNKETVVWEARPDATSGADGGWNSTSFSVDNTKMYRFSVWVYRTVQGNGSFYLGTRGYGSINGVYNRATGSNNTNPYFLSGSITPAQGWQLIVGHVWPAGSGTGALHGDSGRYSVDGFFAGISRDFVWRAETTTANHRSYLYYSTDTSTRQRWCYPRVDICDGTEPSINDLLSGFDSRNIDYIRTKGGTSNISLDVGPKITTVGELSETGPVQDLVAWWPLNGNADDYSGYGNHGTVNGAVVSSGVNGKMAYYLNGNGTTDGVTPGDQIIIPEAVTNTNNYAEGCSYSIWIKVDPISVNRISLLWGAGTIRHIELYSDSNHFRTEAARQNGYSFGSSTFLESAKSDWKHFVIVFANNETNRPVRWYQNGQLFHTGNLDGGTYPGTEYFSFSSIGRSTGSVSYTYAKSFHGWVQDMRIYKKALTPSEINILYSVTGNAETRMKQTQDCLYLKGQLKEV